MILQSGFVASPQHLLLKTVFGCFFFQDSYQILSLTREDDDQDIATKKIFSNAKAWSRTLWLSLQQRYEKIMV